MNNYTFGTGVDYIQYESEGISGHTFKIIDADGGSVELYFDDVEDLVRVVNQMKEDMGL